jgi:molecular chaperone IbpA
LISPRCTVPPSAFDRIADLMDRVLTADVAQPTYPPYNIEKTAEDAYRISIAVAGFTARTT